jgi:hypothetical protein
MISAAGKPRRQPVGKAQDAQASSPHCRREGDGWIQANRVYTLAEFKRRLSLGNHAMRMLRNRGLPVRMLGRQKLVVGRDFLALAMKLPTAEELRNG